MHTAKCTNLTCAARAFSQCETHSVSALQTPKETITSNPAVSLMSAAGSLPTSPHPNDDRISDACHHKLVLPGHVVRKPGYGGSLETTGVVGMAG